MTIGEGARLFPRVTLYARSVIGARTIVHSGAVIGADGFGMAEDAGKWLKIPQVGRVVIGDDCEIGAWAAERRPVKLDGLRAKIDEYMPFGRLPALVMEN